MVAIDVDLYSDTVTRPTRAMREFMCEAEVGDEQKFEDPTVNVLQEMVAELLWVVARAEEHLGSRRAARYLRKFYPWYLERLGAEKSLATALQETDELESARKLIGDLGLARAAA